MTLEELENRLEVDVSGLEKLLVGLVSITGLIHLYVGLTTGFYMLTLAGAGFLAGIPVFLFCSHRVLTVAASIPFTLVQFYEYYQYYGFNFGTLAIVDKTVQALLVVSSLIYLYSQGYLGSKLKRE